MRPIIVLAILLMAGSVTFAATGISSCQNITAPGEYNLTDNLTHSGFNVCVDIQSSDVVLDCDGHSISDGDYGLGIHVGVPGTTVLSNVTVQNCEVYNEGVGIGMTRVSSNNVINNTLHNNNHHIQLIFVNDSNFIDNELYEGNWNPRSMSGITESYGARNNYVNNEIRESDLGMQLYDCEDITISDSLFDYNYPYGLNVVDSSVTVSNTGFFDGPRLINVTSVSNDTDSHVTLSNVIIGNVYGGTQYANVSMVDSTSGFGENYYLAWLALSAPEGYEKFNEMGVAIDNYWSIAEVSIDSITLHWNADEQNGYDEDTIELWRREFGGGWSLLNDTASGMQLSATNVPGGGYLQLLVNLDDDGDGVPDEDDLCPGTVPDVIPDLTPGSYYLGPDGVIYDENGPTDLTGADTYGCSVEQIMYCKPGNNQGESAHGMSPGTLNVWMSQTGWASDCQVDGLVTVPGEGSTIPDVDADQDGKPDWWCEAHPNKC